MDLIITILPVVTKDLPISPRFTPYMLLSRCKFSTLTTRQPMVEFYILTFPRLPIRKKEHKSYFGKNRTHDFRTSRCAAYLLDHSGDATGFSQVVFCSCFLRRGGARRGEGGTLSTNMSVQVTVGVRPAFMHKCLLCLSSLLLTARWTSL